MTPASIDALSPVDGRYRAGAEPLRPILSEAGLIRERIRVEAEWFRFLLADVPSFQRRAPAPAVLACAAQLAADPGGTAAAAISLALRSSLRVPRPVTTEKITRPFVAGCGNAWARKATPDHPSRTIPPGRLVIVAPKTC